VTISFTLKPWHFAVLAFLAGVGLTAAAALAMSSGGDQPGAEAKSGRTVETATPELPTPIARTPTPEPAAPPPPPEPAPLSDRINCAEIRGTDYRSSAERLWFEANCAARANTAVPQLGGLSAPPPPTAVASGCFVSWVLSGANAGTVQARFICDGVPAAGATAVFTFTQGIVGGRTSCSATTSSTGYASCSTFGGGPPGSSVDVCISYQGRVYCAHRDL